MEENKILAERLKSERLKKDLLQKEVAEKLNMTTSAYGFYEQGKRTPDANTLRILAEFYNVSADYLLGRVYTRESLPSNAMPVDTSNLIKIPIVGVIKAGEPILATENILGYEYVTAAEAANGDYFYLKVHGDSMIGARIHDGDYVYIRKQTDVDHGDIAAVLVNGDEATLKRILKADNTVILQPENSKYQPRVFTNKDLVSGHVRIIGKVLHVKFKL